MRKFTWDEILYESNEIEEEITSETRWGHWISKIVEVDGVYYGIDFEIHSGDMGPDIEELNGDPEPYYVKQEVVEVTKWVRVKND